MYGETCPHYLSLDESRYGLPRPEAMCAVISPPLREPGERDRLWRALRDGELDLIALDGRTIVFVEVRSTEDRDLQYPTASVDYVKQKRLTKLATYWLQKKRLLDHPARFDVLILGWPADAAEPTIEHFRNAFEAV